MGMFFRTLCLCAGFFLVVVLGTLCVNSACGGCLDASDPFPAKRGPMIVYWEGGDYRKEESMVRIGDECYYRIVLRGYPPGIISDGIPDRISVKRIDCDGLIEEVE